MLQASDFFPNRVDHSQSVLAYFAVKKSVKTDKRQKMFLVLTVLAVLLIYFTKKHYRQLQLSSKLSGPPGWPLIGNGLDLVNKSPIGKKFL